MNLKEIHSLIELTNSKADWQKEAKQNGQRIAELEALVLKMKAELVLERERSAAERKQLENRLNSLQEELEGLEIELEETEAELNSMQ